MASTASACRSSTRCRSGSSARSTVDGERHYLDFEKGGRLKTKLKATGKAPRGRTRHHHPVLARSVGVHRDDRVPRPGAARAVPDDGLPQPGPRDPLPRPAARRSNPTPTVFKYDGGIIDFVRHVNQTKEALFKKVGYFEQSEDEQEVEIAFQWNTGYNADGLHSFANGIATIEGGMHEEGFRKAITNVVNKYARAQNLLKEKDENLTGEDIREGLTAIISVRLRDPQFEGQTKGKLGNVSIRSLVERATNDKLGDWFEENPTEGRKVVAKAIQAARARQAARSARDATRAQVGARGRGHARQAQGLRHHQPRRGRAVHRRGRLRRRLGHPGPRSRARRRSCPSAARSSTSSGPASTRC